MSSAAERPDTEAILADVERLCTEITNEFDKEVPAHGEILAMAKQLMEHARALGDEEEASDDVWDDAVHVLEELTTHAYNEVECMLLMAECWFEMGHFRRSREILEEVVEIEPSNAEALRLLKERDARVLTYFKGALYGAAGLLALGALYFSWRRQAKQ